MYIGQLLFYDEYNEVVGVGFLYVSFNVSICEYGKSQLYLGLKVRRNLQI